MNIYFSELFVYPKYPDSVIVQWSMNNNSLPENYFFWVYYSDNPEKGFTKLNTAPVINSFIYEFPFALLHKEEYLYIKVTAEIGSETIESTSQGLFYALERRQFLICKEIIRKNNLIRDKFIGPNCQVYKRKVFGVPCPDCIDVHTGLGTDSKCISCFGLKILGGYHDGLDVYCEVVEGDKNIKPSEIGMMEPRFATGKLTYPIVQRGDIIVEKQRNRRWYVNGYKRKTVRTFPIDQYVELRQVSPGDIEYKLGQ
jgi:hypothetical protein